MFSTIYNKVCSTFYSLIVCVQFKNYKQSILINIIDLTILHNDYNTYNIYSNQTY